MVQDRAREAAGSAWTRSDLVFTTRYGDPIEPRNFNRYFAARCAAAGVRRITVHDARRTCATLLVDLDVHPLAWAPDLRFYGVGVLRHYSNRSDLLQQLQSVAGILSGAGRDDGVGADGEASACGVIRSRRLRDRLSPDDVQAMIELYRLGSTARQVAEKFDVSLSSVKRLLRQHGVGREGRRHH
ncbi:MAG: helix-turn-helix domain-containing protein [Pseudonocardiaceae bacterium]